MATHQIPSGSIESTFTPIPAPDLMEILNRTAPGQDGVSILYSLAGALEFRAAKLAGMITNVMAAAIRAGDGTDERPSVDKYNDAMALLDDNKSRDWAFHAAGLSHQDMMQDLRDVLGFRMTVTDKLAQITTKPFLARWADTITRAAEPMPVEGWKLEMSWLEYVEGCHGKPEMTKEEFDKVEGANLAGRKQTWGDHVGPIIAVIESLSGDSLEFQDMNITLQKRILESISSEDKEKQLRTNALKMARNPGDLHTRRAFISSFCSEVRRALGHSRYQERGQVDPALQAEHDAAVERNRKLSPAAEAEANADFLDMASDAI